MDATVRDTRLYFDVEGIGLMPDGAGRRIAFLIHGGPRAGFLLTRS